MSNMEILHLIIIAGAFGTTIATAMGKCPVFAPLMLICVDLLIRALLKG
jgi:hypothetical protein